MKSVNDFIIFRRLDMMREFVDSRVRASIWMSRVMSNFVPDFITRETEECLWNNIMELEKYGPYIYDEGTW